MATEIKTLNMYNNTKRIDFGEKIVVYKFGGHWCKACKDLEENIKNLSDVLVYEIDIENDEFESFLVENKIYSIPDTFLCYKNNEVRFKGLRTTEQLKDLIKMIKNPIEASLENMTIS